MSTPALEASIFFLESLIFRIWDSIGFLIVNGVNALGNQANQLHQIVTQNINDQTDIIGDTLDKQKVDIQNSINQQTAELNETLAYEVGLIAKAIEADNIAIERTLAKQALDVETGFTNIVGGLTSIFDGLADRIAVDVTNNITLDDSLLTTLTAQVSGVIDDSLVALETQRNGFLDFIKTFIDRALEPLLAGASATEKIGIDIVKAILENAGGVGNVAEQVKAVGEELLKGSVIVQTVLGNHGQAEIAAEGLADQFRRIINVDFKSTGLLCDPVPENNEWVPDNPFINAIVNGVMLAISAVTVPFMMASQRGQICLQNDSLKNPWQILSPGDAAEAYHRRIIDRDAALDEIKRGGFSDAKANILLDTTNVIPQLDILFAEWFRDLITDDALDSELQSLGFTDTRIDLLKQIAFFIPPAQDLITMAVREVFSPEQRRLNRQDDNFPPDFLKYAKQQGISEFWARNYWAAHWQLPSVQMGYEMLHRGQINETRLKQLMQALDIMPGWVDPLIAISYTPFSRVDIRRMHALEVFSDSDVVRAYQDIGYSPDNAQLQLQFVQKLNEGDDLLTLDVASDLTRSNIIQFYKRGIIPNSLAVALMLQAGINAGATTLFLQNADFEIELKERKDQIDLVLDRYKVEEIDHATADTELRGLGLESTELQAALLDLEKLRIGKVKQPSKADLDKFMKAGLIEAATYVEMLMRSGYSEDWAFMYLHINQGITPNG